MVVVNVMLVISSGWAGEPSLPLALSVSCLANNGTGAKASQPLDL